MSDDLDKCDDCGRPIYDYLDVDEQDKIDQAEAHDQYCCSEKGYPDPSCYEVKMRKMRDEINAARKLIALVFPVCEMKNCKEFATMGSPYYCDSHRTAVPVPEGSIIRTQHYDMNYAEALREFLKASEKNGKY